jgi:enoyl-CoA hydratase/carnithine racemase
MSGEGALRLEPQGAALVVTIDRPGHANAYTQAMLAQLEQAIAAADADSAIRALVITGAGDRAFCAGADRTEIAERDWRSVLSLRSAAVFERLRRCRKVTIAAINGAAVGGGMELAISCDLRVASPRARFWLPEPEFGLLPAAAATKLLPRIVGPLRARDLVLGGARWDAQAAWSAGLLSEVAPEGGLMQSVRAWVDQVARRDPDALMLGKQALDLSFTGEGMQFDLLAQTLLVQLQAQRGPDHA